MSVFDSCLAKLNEPINEIGITPDTIVLVVKYAMEVVELTNLKGVAQKEMTLRLTRKIVDDSPLDDEKKKICISLIENGTLSQTIDLVVDASKGRLQINKKTAVRIGSCCFQTISNFLSKK